MRRDSGKVIQEKANVLWNVANTISGLYKPHEYGLVILPMAVVKRFHDCLMKTHDKVLAKAKELGKNAIKDAFLQKASGYRKTLNYSDFAEIKSVQPPLPEQQAIAAYLDRKCAAIDRVVAEKEGLIADLEQYKKSLIFECVTGKREVA